MYCKKEKEYIIGEYITYTLSIPISKHEEAEQ